MTCLMLSCASWLSLAAVSLVLLLAISTLSLPKSLACYKGFRLASGLILHGSWAQTAGVDAVITCKRDWAFPGGARRDFVGLGLSWRY